MVAVCVCVGGDFRAVWRIAGQPERPQECTLHIYESRCAHVSRHSTTWSDARVIIRYRNDAIWYPGDGFNVLWPHCRVYRPWEVLYQIIWCSVGVEDPDLRAFEMRGARIPTRKTWISPILRVRIDYRVAINYYSNQFDKIVNLENIFGN